MLTTLTSTRPLVSSIGSEGYRWNANVATFKTTFGKFYNEGVSAKIQWLGGGGDVVENAVVEGGGDTFTVKPQDPGHFFTDDGGNLFVVTLKVGNVTSIVTGSTQIYEAGFAGHASAPTIVAVPVAGSSAMQFEVNNVETAYFNDNFYNDPKGSYAAVIHWGDGASSPGTLVGNLLGGLQRAVLGSREPYVRQVPRLDPVGGTL